MLAKFTNLDEIEIVQKLVKKGLQPVLNIIKVYADRSNDTNY